MTRPWFRACFRFLTGFVAPGTLCAQVVANSGFETRDASGRPAGWIANGPGFEIVIDSVGALAGRGSLRTRWIGDAPYQGTAAANAAQFFPGGLVSGKRLRLTGYLRTENVQQGGVGFFLRVDGPRGTLMMDNMLSRSVRGTTPWTRYDIELPVDSSATMIMFGTLHHGDGTAWFDSVRVDIIDGTRMIPIPAPNLGPRPAEDLTRLLTDSELAVPLDATAIEDAAVSDWVKKNAHPIRSLSATNFSDLRFLAPLLDGKRIVQLGESSHGTAEFSLAKTRLIKYLHEELGYDVIAFESSVYECERADQNVATLSSLELMRGCIFGVWHTAEALPLFDYIKETRRTARPLTLAGFDMQVSAPLSVQSRPSVLRALIAPLDLAYADRVYETDREFLTRLTPAYMAQNRDRFVAFYDTLAVFFRKNQKVIAAANPNDPHIAVIARQTAASMVVHARQLAATVNGVSVAAAELRDSAMASNLDFLLDELYPGKKIIVWGHNSHIRHSGRNQSQKSMGSWVAERRRTELYTIGLYMYSGVSAGNNRAPLPVSTSPSGSFESILHRSPWRYSYVDFSRPQRMRGTEWMWSPLRSLYWGMTPETIVPREAYDGVLFFDRTHLPTYR